MVTHPSTNRARRRASSLIKTNALYRQPNITTKRYGKPNAYLRQAHPSVCTSTAFAAGSDHCHSPELGLPLRLIEWMEKCSNGEAAKPDDEQSRQFGLRVSRVVRRLISADACLSERAAKSSFFANHTELHPRE